MSTRSFVLASACLGVLSAAGAYHISAMSAVTQTVWWPIGATVVTGATMMSRWWVSRARKGSPMAFVAAVNGSTAIKMFSLLALTAAYMVTHQEGRVEFALGIFGVFVLQLVFFVWDVASLMQQDKKKS